MKFNNKLDTSNKHENNIFCYVISPIRRVATNVGEQTENR